MFPAFNEVKTMSSREIAELTGKNHADVLRDIRNVLTEAGIDESKFAGIYKDSMNRDKPELNLPRRECDLVISGYSVKYRLAIIDRWQELEKQSFTIPTTLSGALRLAAEQAETIEHQQALISQQNHAVEFVERYVESTGSKGFREVCKLLNAKENEFREFLLNNKIMQRIGGSLMPMAAHQALGRFEVKTGNGENDHAFMQAKFTPKGIQWVAGLWAAHKLEF